MTLSSQFKGLLSLVRPHFWLKNFFVLWGGTLSCAWVGIPVTSQAGPLFWGTFSACLLSSANYLLNDWADTACDRHHPLKKNRLFASGKIESRRMKNGYLILTGTGLLTAACVSLPFFFCCLAFLVLGGLYNVRPVRLKDRTLWDIISESAFSPLRIAMGWFIVSGAAAVPITLLLAFWLAAGYFMGRKRSCELRLFKSKTDAGRYRRPLEKYTGQRLLKLSLSAAFSSLILFSVFLSKDCPDLAFCLPWVAGLFVWHYLISRRACPSILLSQGLFQNKAFSVYCLIFCYLLQVHTALAR